MTCDLCEPAPHPNCETYTKLIVTDPSWGDEKMLEVCLEHYEAFEQADDTEGER